MTGWLEIHRAKLTPRVDEITFSLIDLKDLWREARKGNVLTSGIKLSTTPQLDGAPPQR